MSQKRIEPLFSLLKGMIYLGSVLFLNSGSTTFASVGWNSTEAGITGETNPKFYHSLISAANKPDRRFTCETFNGEWTVMYHPQGQSDDPSGNGLKSQVSYPWAVPNKLGDGWTSERRCREISDRLELYRPDGLLELQTAVENGQEILCVTTQKNSSCRIVFTVPPDQNAAVTLELVFQNLVLADSGQPTQGVNTFVGNNTLPKILNLSGFGVDRPPNINLLPFLAPADGGSGTQLR